MKVKNKILILLIIIYMVGMLINLTYVNAALQANGSSGTTATIYNWVRNIRYMEATGGTLGLTDTIDSSSLDSTAAQKNNLDIHMQKNTEYGAMAILSASAYGNPNKIPNGGTTTGNKTGVYIYLNEEWVSAVGDLNYNSISEVRVFNTAKSKYKNYYTGYSYVAKVGDAIGETSGWHGSGESRWIDYTSVACLIRSYSGSIFSYFGLGQYPGWNANYTQGHSSRAVIVVGEGF